MHNIWAPQDNKFVTELQVLLEQIKFNIRRLESDLKINSNLLETLKIQIETLNENIILLKNDKTKIVSVNEYRTISESLKRADNQKKILEHKNLSILKYLEDERKKIPIVESEIEKVKFKLLKFKKI
jgi:protein associated with RNAse G/E